MKRVLAYLGSIALLFALWWALSAALELYFGGGHKAAAFPNPWNALVAFGENWQALSVDFGASALRVLIALALALGVAGPLGLIVGFEPSLNRWLSPLLYTTYPIPKIVFLPVLFVLMGIGEEPKVTLITLVIAFQVLLSARDAAQNISKSHVLSVRSAGANRWQIYRHVVFPGALPAILTSARVSIGLAIATLYLVETFATRYGLGKFINKEYDLASFTTMFAGIMAMGLLGLILYAVLDALEHWLCRWKHR